MQDLDLGPERSLTRRELAVPAAGALLFALVVLTAVGFDQGPLAALATDALADRGGLLHELFHDARHLLGVPCH